MPLGILPTGTLNHFAKDLGLPLDLAAARVIAARNVQRVDVAELNGRRLHQQLLDRHLPAHRRPARPPARSVSAAANGSSMLAGVHLRLPPLSDVRVRIVVDGPTELRTTPFVFVGNNRYEMKFTTLGQRDRLDEGELSLWFANVTRAIRIISPRACDGIRIARAVEGF